MHSAPITIALISKPVGVEDLIQLECFCFKVKWNKDIGQCKKKCIYLEILIVLDL